MHRHVYTLSKCIAKIAKCESELSFIIYVNCCKKLYSAGRMPLLNIVRENKDQKSLMAYGIYTIYSQGVISCSQISLKLYIFLSSSYNILCFCRLYFTFTLLVFVLTNFLLQFVVRESDDGRGFSVDKPTLSGLMCEH